MEEKVSNGVIIAAIVITLFWVSIFFAIIEGLSANPYFLPALIYIVVHPIIGKLFSELVESLCEGIDEIYELSSDKEWGKWSKETKILFAAMWPLAGTIGLIVTVIGVIYGLLYKNLFR